jgi:hypothetical protein
VLGDGDRGEVPPPGFSRTLRSRSGNRCHLIYLVGPPYERDLALRRLCGRRNS